MKVFSLGLSSNGEPIGADGSKFLSLPIPHDPYILRFVVFSWAEVIHRGSLWTNIPPKGTPFDRSKFYEHPLHGSDDQSTADHAANFTNDIHVDIEISDSGPYSYYITFLPPQQNYLEDKGVEDLDLDDKNGFACTRQFYINVSAGFSLNNKPLSLDALAIQTVLSKPMGPVKNWEPKLKAIAAKNYNMIHFVPLQHRGASDSPFSLYDQLSFDPHCFPNGEKDVAELVKTMESKHGLLSLTDVVLNHTANNSPWLPEHPDATYNVDTAPHLRPALELDSKLLEFSSRLGELGLPTTLNSVADLDKVMGQLRSQVIDPLELWKYYVLDVNKVCSDIMAVIQDHAKYDKIDPVIVPENAKGSLNAIAKFVLHTAGENFEKFGTSHYVRTVNPVLATAIFKFLHGDDIGEAHLESNIRRVLDEINEPLYQEYDEDVQTIISQVYNRTKYMRVDDNGMKLGPITKESPLIETYFTRVDTKNGEVAMVNNGWVWGGNPLKDFAGPSSKAYLCREVIIWGDCVKLRYGNGPEDSPFLWDHMTKYVQLLAKYFHGFRIDNCHSTPLHVGEYMLDRARLVRSNLYVAAELFTGSERMDKIFVERLGITSLIREAMQAWSVKELSTLVNKHGGRPMGSFSRQPLTIHGQSVEQKEDIILVRPSLIHAWFMDCTHDNESAAQKRTVEDTLPSAALVAMSACAIGSTVGFDECYRNALNVVSEDRQYTFGGGITEIRELLNQLHVEMGQSAADETYTHLEGQYITLHRVHAKTGKGYFLVARTKFHPDSDQKLSDVYLDGNRAKCILASSLVCEDGSDQSSKDELRSMKVRLNKLTPLNIEWDDGAKRSIIRMPEPSQFPQGSIAIIETQLDFVDEEFDTFVRTGAKEAVSQLDLVDLNVALYRCESEERDGTNGEFGTYSIPSFGSLPYAGMQGWATLLNEIVLRNDLGHSLCNNLREGHWALDYTVNRLKKYESSGFDRLGPLIKWVEQRFDRIRTVPSFLAPRYFALVVFAAYAACEARALKLMSPWIINGGQFIHKLAMTSVQMVARLNTASIVPKEQLPSMAAGLPHFSSSYMRCWGRDVFISLPGLLLKTGRHTEAKQHILAFAATCKHGLIPNLLDSGNNPRYNARDAAWFFLQSIQEYVKDVPGGVSILDESVHRRFPLDDTWVDVNDERAFSQTTSLREIIYEILARHAQSIKFREANAGPNLDSQMKDNGFNQYIYVDWDNGMIFGGNPDNCGTWMDKMGESSRAGSKGVPGTPRDGADIEIIGLLKSALRWVLELNAHGHFDYTSVKTQHGNEVSFKEWDDKLQNSFERCFYIPKDPQDDHKYEIDANIVNRRGIYKDIFRSTKPYEDYQLRPNFAIAMTVAPELFEVDHAISAISVADKALRGPVGMATLDPSDFNYRPYYNNSEDSTDFATSKGRNYHQGPEWAWCIGYFFRAFLTFDIKRTQRGGQDLSETFQQLRSRMTGHVRWIKMSPWQGITELTNKNGELCNDSSPTQAWSTGTLIDLFYLARSIGH